MKRTILAAALAALSASAFAWDTTNNTAAAVGVGIAGAQAGSTALATSPSFNYNAPSTSSGATVFSSPYTSSGALSGGNTQTLTVQGTPAQQTITHNGRSQVESVPNVYAPNIYPTAPCMGSSSAGAGWLGFGFSGGSSWEAKECQIMEASRNAPTPADRIYVWCKSVNAAGAPSCAGLKPEPVATTGSIPAERDRLSDATIKAAPGSEVWGVR